MMTPPVLPLPSTTTAPESPLAVNEPGSPPGENSPFSESHLGYLVVVVNLKDGGDGIIVTPDDQLGAFVLA